MYHIRYRLVIHNEKNTIRIQLKCMECMLCNIITLTTLLRSPAIWLIPNFGLTKITLSILLSCKR